jgi:hypothetical protein
MTIAAVRSSVLFFAIHLPPIDHISFRRQVALTLVDGSQVNGNAGTITSGSDKAIEVLQQN